MMKDLVGATIKQVFVNEDQHYLKFVTDKGEFVYFTGGDCCSESLFADILFSYDFFNKEIVSVEELEVPEWVNHMAEKDGRTRQEFNEVYGYQLKTGYKSIFGKQFCDIIFRNLSNGYYGGWCSLVNMADDFYKVNYHNKNLKEAAWEEIKEDWRA